MLGFFNENLEQIFPDKWVKDDVQYPAAIFSVWSDEQLAEVGVYRGYDDGTVTPNGKVIDRYEYVIDGSRVVGTPVFVDAPLIVPQLVSKAQGKAALLQFGLLDAIIAYISGLEGVNKTLAEIAFNDTATWNRESPFLNEAATTLGLTKEQLDNLFIVAGDIIL